MSPLRIIPTGDGSHSLLNEELQETYHSVHGAIRESAHVFIDHGLKHFVNQFPEKKDVRILEIGFGTGLNVLLTLQQSRTISFKIRMESWEKYPLPPDIIAGLNHGDLLDQAEAWKQIHEAPWGFETNLSSTFSIFKRKGDVVSDTMTGVFDVIYYDAFAPSKQPELWSREVLSKVIAQLNPGGVWVSYCARGQVKRDLASIGLKVETLPGPPGKKEMTRAIRVV